MGQAGKARQEEEGEVNGYLFDTHTWLWVMQRAEEEVSSHFFANVEDWQRRGLALLSPFSCWELGLLVAAKQLKLDRSVEFLWQRDTTDGAFNTAPLTVKVLVESTRLPGDVHKDPSDRILIATAREYDLTLVTRDWRILDYAKHGHIKVRKP